MYIYCYIYENEIIYIGSTKNLKKRINDHNSCFLNENSKHYNSHFYNLIRMKDISIKDLELDYYQIKSNITRKQLYDLEYILIQQENPCGNYLKGMFNEKEYDKIRSNTVKRIENRKIYSKTYKRKEQRRINYFIKNLFK